MFTSRLLKSARTPEEIATKLRGGVSRKDAELLRQGDPTLTDFKIGQMVRTDPSLLKALLESSRAAEPLKPERVSQSLLGSVFGWFGGSSSEAKSAPAPDSFSPRVFAASPIDRTGLYNVGNTCWLNALTQMLFLADSAYREPLVRQTKREDVYGERARELCEILILSRHDELSEDQRECGLNDEQRSNLLKRQSRFVEKLYASEQAAVLRGQGRQEDAHEGFDALIYYLGLEKVPGVHSTQVKFSMDSDLKTEPKTELTTPVILRHPTDKKARSIQELISNSFFTSEELDADNRCYFDKENKEVERTLSVSYLNENPEAPITDVLIQAPRFTADRQKDDSPIHFEPILHLPIYDKKGTHIEKVLKLELRAVVCHEGESAEKGHYTTIKYNPSETLGNERPYVVFDDSHVYAGYRGESYAFKYNNGDVTTNQYISVTGYLASYHVIGEEDIPAGAPTVEDAVSKARATK